MNGTKIFDIEVDKFVVELIGSSMNMEHTKIERVIGSEEAKVFYLPATSVLTLKDVTMTDMEIRIIEAKGSTLDFLNF